MFAMPESPNEVASATQAQPGVHGGTDFGGVVLDTYNAELQDSEGFIGDRASMRAFSAMLDDERQRVQARAGTDPMDELGDQPSKEALDDTLKGGDPQSAGVVLEAVESFAQEFAAVIRRFLRLPKWRDTEQIAVGGGMRGSRIGELAIERTTLLLKSDGLPVRLVPIWNHPDEAGLIGAIHLAPEGMLRGSDAILAADIGGTNIRVGCVVPNQQAAADLSCASVFSVEQWCHRDEQPARDEAVQRLISLLREAAERAAAKGHRLAPFVGIGCPGLIRSDGSIERGGQNLPGNWEADGFRLPALLTACLPEISGHRPLVVMHNDAVVQGLSELPRMRGVKHWGVLTIGTGLGNARFSSSRPVEA